jgi:hypothetical protein
MTPTRSVRASPGEKARALPGDELIPEAVGSFTHAVTIHGTAGEVWPWLAQMGAGSRAGWYSYDWIDNGHHPSAARIIPELQPLAVGMVFPALPGATDGFEVLMFEPEHFLILGWRLPDGTLMVTWAFVLDPGAPGSTRLITRARGGRAYRFHGLPWWLSWPIVAAVHAMMERKQLRGIARRVEGRPP